MVHPLAQDFSKLNDNELQEKLDDLNKKYWIATEPVRQQIILMLDSLKLEQENRRMAEKKQENADNNLDNLINIS